MRLGVEPRGLVGSGWTTSEPYEAPHWDPDRAAKGRSALYVEVYFDVLEKEPIVGIRELAKPPFADIHWQTQISGIEMLESAAKELESLWAQRTAGENTGGLVLHQP